MRPNIGASIRREDRSCLCQHGFHGGSPGRLVKRLISGSVAMAAMAGRVPKLAEMGAALELVSI